MAGEGLRERADGRGQPPAMARRTGRERDPWRARSNPDRQMCVLGQGHGGGESNVGVHSRSQDEQWARRVLERVEQCRDRCVTGDGAAMNRTLQQVAQRQFVGRLCQSSSGTGRYTGPAGGRSGSPDHLTSGSHNVVASTLASNAFTGT